MPNGSSPARLGLAAALLIALSTPGPAAASQTDGPKQTKLAQRVDPGECHASYSKQRRRCTIQAGHCSQGYVPIAHPPACDCQCQRGPAKKS